MFLVLGINREDGEEEVLGTFPSREEASDWFSRWRERNPVSAYCLLWIAYRRKG